jgi:hypothetical protein
MPRTFFVLTILFSTTLNAQIVDSQKGWAATLTSTTVPIGQPGLGIQPGAEYRFNERYSLLAEIAFRANHNVSEDSEEYDKHYIKFKAEFRYAFSSRKKLSNDYIGFQVSRAARSFVAKNGFYYDDPPQDSVNYYSSASIKSPVTTASLQFGTIVGDGRFAVDIFIGIGARFIHTDLSNVTNKIKGLRADPPDGLHYIASYSYEGNKTMFHCNGGLRFMWHFYDVMHPRKKKH